MRTKSYTVNNYSLIEIQTDEMILHSEQAALDLWNPLNAPVKSIQ